jgi:hypothetical protein
MPLKVPPYFKACTAGFVVHVAPGSRFDLHQAIQDEDCYKCDSAHERFGYCLGRAYESSFVQSQSVCSYTLPPHKKGTNDFSVSRADGFPYPLDDVDVLEETSLAKFEAYLKKKANNNGCTLEKAAKRQEWYGQPTLMMFNPVLTREA